ncbi:MFS general substrate transporter [Trametes maxima]|nr:MFS general substrate transporter [Trametes maxima]
MSSVQASESDRPSDPTPAIETLPAPIALKDENQLGPLDTGVPSSTLHKLDLGFLPIPKHLQYDPEHPAQFSLAMNVTFGIASTFIVANLYYCQPLLSDNPLIFLVPLVEFSWSFGVTYREVSNIPTLVQAGYGIGILFITPLGDLVRRRPLLILLNIIIASLTIGLAITKNLVVFEVLSFLIGIGSVAPQILTPLPVDLAPPERRASALSIVLSGLLFGVLIARVLAGVVAQFVTWRVVYYVAIGVQCAVLVMLYWTLPDYPAKNKGFTYFGILYSMAKFTVTEPLLVQTILITIPSSACLTNWWATLTFLLGAPPVVQLLDVLVIGLFGLVGMAGVATAPLIGRMVDKLVPWSATLVAIVALLTIFAIQTAAVGLNVAVVIIICIGLDVFRQTEQVSLSAAVLGLDASARSRLNAVVILSLFIGSVMGTSVGSKVFTEYGWRADAALNLGWTAWTLGVLFLRGPHCPRYMWIGWEGGFELRKSRVVARAQVAAATELENVPGQGGQCDRKDEERDIIEEKRGPEERRCSPRESPPIQLDIDHGDAASPSSAEERGT